MMVDVIDATVVVMVTALQLFELKIDVHCGIIDLSSNVVDVLVLLAGV